MIHVIVYSNILYKKRNSIVYMHTKRKFTFCRFTLNEYTGHQTIMDPLGAIYYSKGSTNTADALQKMKNTGLVDGARRGQFYFRSIYRLSP